MMPELRTHPELTVWYNTRCPVCDAGIGRQKRRLLAAIRAGRIEFRDATIREAERSGTGGEFVFHSSRCHEKAFRASRMMTSAASGWLSGVVSRVNCAASW